MKPSDISYMVANVVTLACQAPTAPRNGRYSFEASELFGKAVVAKITSREMEPYLNGVTILVGFIRYTMYFNWHTMTFTCIPVD